MCKCACRGLFGRAAARFSAIESR
jgi:hypothetical protein